MDTVTNVTNGITYINVIGNVTDIKEDHIQPKEEKKKKETDLDEVAE